MEEGGTFVAGGLSEDLQAHMTLLGTSGDTVSRPVGSHRKLANHDEGMMARKKLGNNEIV